MLSALFHDQKIKSLLLRKLKGPWGAGDMQFLNKLEWQIFMGRGSTIFLSKSYLVQLLNVFLQFNLNFNSQHYILFSFLKKWTTITTVCVESQFKSTFQTFLPFYFFECRKPNYIHYLYKDPAKQNTAENNFTANLTYLLLILCLLKKKSPKNTKKKSL